MAKTNGIWVKGFILLNGVISYRPTKLLQAPAIICISASQIKLGSLIEEKNLQKIVKQGSGMWVWEELYGMELWMNTMKHHCMKYAILTQLIQLLLTRRIDEGLITLSEHEDLHPKHQHLHKSKAWLFVALYFQLCWNQRSRY